MGRIKLKNCPFCGGEATHDTNYDCYDNEYHMIICEHCSIYNTGFGSYEEAAKAWNTRHTPEPEMTESLKKMLELAKPPTKEPYLCDLCGMKEPTHQVINHGTKLCSDCAVGYIYPCREI